MQIFVDSSQAKQDQTSTAVAYQIAFDLYDNGTQEFLSKVIKSLPEPPTPESENCKFSLVYHLRCAS